LFFYFFRKEIEKKKKKEKERKSNKKINYNILIIVKPLSSDLFIKQKSPRVKL